MCGIGVVFKWMWHPGPTLNLEKGSRIAQSGQNYKKSAKFQNLTVVLWAKVADSAPSPVYSAEKSLGTLWTEAELQYIPTLRKIFTQK